MVYHPFFVVFFFFNGRCYNLKLSITTYFRLFPKFLSYTSVPFMTVADLACKRTVFSFMWFVAKTVQDWQNSDQSLNWQKCLTMHLETDWHIVSVGAHHFVHGVCQETLIYGSALKKVQANYCNLCSILTVPLSRSLTAEGPCLWFKGRFDYYNNWNHS